MLLVYQLVGLTLLGLVVSLMVTLYFLKGKNPIIALVLALGGMLGGLSGAMIWIFATGGLEESAFMSIPSAICALLFVFLLMKYFGISIKETKKRSIPAPIATGLIFLSLTLVLILSVAIDIESVGKVEGGTSSNILDYDDTVRLGTSQEQDPSDWGEWIYESWEDNVLIDIEQSAVRFPRITADNPNIGDYLEFEITFSVSTADWTQPYIKISPFYDLNGDGVWDIGTEDLWATEDYKLALSNSGESSYWRTNLGWDEGSPVVQLNNVLAGSVPLIMPVFHYSSWGNEQYEDDNGIVFDNTPETYTSPRDQISWERVSTGDYSLMEFGNVVYRSIPVGGSASITGKIHCPDYTEGVHGLLVQAYDESTGTDPYNPYTEPLSQVVESFVVGNPSDYPVVDVTITAWVATTLLTVGTVGGAAVAASKIKPFMIKM